MIVLGKASLETKGNVQALPIDTALNPEFVFGIEL